MCHVSRTKLLDETLGMRDVKAVSRINAGTVWNVGTQTRRIIRKRFYRCIFSGTAVRSYAYRIAYRTTSTNVNVCRKQYVNRISKQSTYPIVIIQSCFSLGKSMSLFRAHSGRFSNFSGNVYGPLVHLDDVYQRNSGMLQIIVWLRLDGNSSCSKSSRMIILRINRYVTRLPPRLEHLRCPS